MFFLITINFLIHVGFGLELFKQTAMLVFFRALLVYALDMFEK